MFWLAHTFWHMMHHEVHRQARHGVRFVMLYIYFLWLRAHCIVIDRLTISNGAICVRYTFKRCLVMALAVE